ncbi:MAG: MFS transporter [Lachnospiraceae bacterium]|nr:MFS transporter [Lachnospiraceae bacterium]
MLKFVQITIKKILNIKETDRNFTKLMLSHMISNLGDYFYLVSILWVASSIAEDALYLSTINLFDTLPGLIFGFFIGAIIDKLNKKRIMVNSDFIRAIIIFVLIVVFSLGKLEIWHIYIATFLLELFNRIFSTSQLAIIPEIIEKENLQKANSYSNLITQIMGVIGNSISGLAISVFGILFSLIANALSFIFSGILLSTLRTKNINNCENSDIDNKISLSKVFREIIEGFVYLKSKPIILLCLSMSFSLSIALSSVILIPLYIKNDLSLGAAYYGVIEGSCAFSMIIFSLVLTKKVIKRPVLYMALSSIIIGSSFIFMSINQNIIILFIGRLVMSTMLSLFNIIFITQLQKYVESSYSGRVFTISYFFSSILYPIFSIISGYIATKTSIRFSWLIVGSIVTIINVINLFVTQTVIGTEGEM